MLIIIGILIGLVLGLTGSGGSVFAVPLLIVFAGLSPSEAVGLSLVTVAASAVFGCLRFRSKQPVLWKPGLVFAFAGVLLVPLGQWLNHLLPAYITVIAFSVVAVTVAQQMWRRAINHPELASITRGRDLSELSGEESVTCRMNPTGQFQLKPRCLIGMILGGALVGLMSGFLGVGGGFLIIPILLYLSQIETARAVSTSLVIISIISSVGFVSYFLHSNSSLNDTVYMLLPLVIGGIVGMFFGQRLTVRIADDHLQKGFAMTLVLMSVIMCVSYFYGN
ncbi:MAG TPA: sulfite exporter TauE/SafE family protein [Methylophaga aminisulfidivorans]|nr:sulfite exporter TauE/SafE family protein [Methylophaga aminisulfidivorans]